jgi:hypothetical protein
MPRNVDSTGSGPEPKLSLAVGPVFVGFVGVNDGLSAQNNSIEKSAEFCRIAATVSI